MNSTEQAKPFKSSCNNCDTLNCTPLYNPKTCTNSGFNYGISSRLSYDPSTIRDDIEQSTAPLQSMLDTNRVRSCQRCQSNNGGGPRSSYGGWGNQLVTSNPGNYPRGQLSDIDSIMKNMNVKNSTDRKGRVNPINVLDFKTHTNTTCNKTLDPVSSLLSFPKQLNRSMSINRFYDLNINPQVNIYYDRSVNSQLEAKDNFQTPYPANIPGGFSNVKPTPVVTQPDANLVSPPHYDFGSNPPVFDIRTYPEMNGRINPDFETNQVEEEAILTDSDDDDM